MKIKKTIIILIISLLVTNIFAQEKEAAKEPDLSNIQSEKTESTSQEPAPQETVPQKATSQESVPQEPAPQETTSQETKKEVKENTQQEKESFSPTDFRMENIDLILQFEPIMYLSPESKRNNSNIVNILYSFTFGASFPRDFFVAFQPTLSFFSMHHAWLGDIALPTEIENRTTTTLSFLLNLPAAFNIELKKSRIQLTAGLAALLRFGLLSNGVNDNDSGYTGSAANDVKEINKWFWEKGRFLYLSLGGSWLYNITSKIKIGPVLNVYLPFASMAQYKKPQDLIISLGVKICR